MFKASHITVTFRRRDGSKFDALRDVTIEVPEGKIVALVGESGSGKTTLVRTICGLQKPTSGEIEREKGEGKIGMVFQDAVGALDPRQTVGSAIREILQIHRVVAKESLEGEVKRLLSLVGLPEDVIERRPSALSGGQCQRVCIARALALRPTLLIGDEPVSALDVSVQARILHLLEGLMRNRESGLQSLLLVTHDLAVVSAVCDMVYVLQKGEVVEAGIPEEIFAAPRHPYTRRLLDACCAR